MAKLHKISYRQHLAQTFLTKFLTFAAGFLSIIIYIENIATAMAVAGN
jgi:hypothetical protein